MRLLVDTHVLIWAIDEPSRLSATAAAAVATPGNELLLSAGTLWEVGIKVGLGKLGLSAPFRDWMTDAITRLSLTLVPITVEIAEVQSRLPHHHGDPFDRLLVATAVVERVPVVSADPKLDPYPVTRLW